MFTVADLITSLYRDFRPYGAARAEAVAYVVNLVLARPQADAPEA